MLGARISGGIEASKEKGQVRKRLADTMNDTIRQITTRTKMIEACCVWMERMLLNAGESGICVVAFRDGDVRQFFLQARPLTRGQARNWGLLMESEPLKGAVEPLFHDECGRLAPLHTLMRVPMEYCPQCGRNLETMVRRQRVEFDELAEAHAALQGE